MASTNGKSVASSFEPAGPVDRSRRRARTYIGLIVGLALGYGLLRGVTWKSGAQFHTLLETAATLLASGVGVGALVRFYSKRDTTLLFVGTAFVGTAFLDGYHAMVTSTYFSQLFPSGLGSLIPWSWVASRLFLSVFLFLSWVFWRRELRMGSRGETSPWFVYVVVGISAMASFLFFAFIPLPRAYYPEFVFHRPEEFLPAAFFLLALIGFWKKGQWRHDSFEHWLMMSTIVGFMSQAMFMSFSAALFDPEFDVAHSLKIVTYLMVYIGLLISMLRLFRQAESSSHRLSLLAEELEFARDTAESATSASQLANQELTRSNEDLQQFAAVASHDLQAPVRNILNATELLTEDLNTGQNDEVQTYIEIIEEGATRMSTLVTSILEYATASSGSVAGQADLGAVMHDVFLARKVELQDASGELTVGELPNVAIDQVQAYRVFDNLVSNAIKYRSSDRPLSIVVSGSRSGALAIVSVADNGVGIARSDEEAVFTMFSRLHPDAAPGSGVGLAIVKRIIERHRGTIGVESRPGAGTVFRMELPAA